VDLFAARSRSAQAERRGPFDNAGDSGDLAGFSRKASKTCPNVRRVWRRKDQQRGLFDQKRESGVSTTCEKPELGVDRSEGTKGTADGAGGGQCQSSSPGRGGGGEKGPKDHSRSRLVNGRKRQNGGLVMPE